MTTEIKWSDGQAILTDSTMRWSDGGAFSYYEIKTSTLSLGVHTSKYIGTTSALTTTTGSCIIIGVNLQDGPIAPEVTDSKGNIYTQVGSVVGQIYAGYNNYIALYKNEGGNRGSSHTFTVAGVNSIWVQEIIGNNPVVDTVNTGNVDTESPFTSNPYTPNVANEILLCITAPYMTPNVDLNVTWGGGFTSTGDDINSSGAWYGSLGYQVISSITEYVASVDYGSTAARGGFLILGVMESGGGSSAIVKTNLWNKIFEVNLIDGGVVKDVQEAYISVNGVWEKWWPPPA